MEVSIGSFQKGVRVTAETSPTVRRRRLASELRRLRTERDLPMQSVADRMEMTAASLSRIETGRRGIKSRDLRALLGLYEVPETDQEALLALAREAQQKGWWQQHANVLTTEYATLIGLEAEASTIRNYEQSLVPGLLQTEAYARSVTTAFRPGDSSEETDRLVSVRLKRQERLDDSAFELSAILGEAVIRQSIGTPAIMAEQLSYLAKASRKPNIMVQVLPFRAGGHPALTGSFSIVGFPAYSDMDVVYLENMTSAVYLEEASEVRSYGTVFDYLRAAALSPNDSATMLIEASEALI
ncbi:helix-turn-helix transcriptional regulator [Nonomuraea sp. NEAU-A123]|uniref:helix-turn-helix domain-containing protein n=1 Tax=Nonomuraea sp. NEAU-A123 TaxID=2839649 RepID=UPI001BE3E405|nr:helix-turn-helix transcriptional regulator [Nonomuraea sp. NEAU-A123]MBT2229384.1 helix-turn-helix domain-containing protein [Nonomuraea sp. NEAU-A123]